MILQLQPLIQTTNTLTTDNRDADEVVNHVVDTCHAPTINNE